MNKSTTISLFWKLYRISSFKNTNFKIANNNIEDIFIIRSQSKQQNNLKMRQFVRILLLMIQVLVIQGLDFNINFQIPMTLPSQIKFIQTTPNGRIIIHFQNQNWNVYNSSFGLITTFQVRNQTWSQIKIFNDSFSGILNDAKNLACFFDLSSYTASLCNSMNGIIGIQPMVLFVRYIAVANSTNFIAYSTLFPLSLRTLNPLASFNFVDYSSGVASAQNGSVYRIKLVGFNYTYTLIYSHSSAVSLLQIINSAIVFTQDVNNVIKAYNLSSNSSMNVASALFNELISIKKIQANLMFIYSPQICYVSYNSPNLQYQRVNSKAFNASISNLMIITTSVASLAYIPQSNFVYSVSQCKGNMVYDGSVCVPYACDKLLCLYCPVHPSICSQCLYPYELNQQISCVMSPINSSGVNNSSLLDNSSGVNNSTFLDNSSGVNNSSGVDNSSVLDNSSGLNNFSNDQNSSNVSNIDTIYNYSKDRNCSNCSQENLLNLHNSNRICGFFSESNQNGECISKSNYKTINTVLDAFTFLNSVSFVRVLIKFVTPLYSFYDDYWYYIYNLYPSNNSFSYMYLLEVYDINNQRIIPNLAPTDTLQRLTDISTYANTSNFDPYSPSTILSLQGQNIYFLHLIIPMVAQNWFLSIFLFLICKLLYKFFNSKLAITSKNGVSFKILNYFSNYFENLSLNGMLFISIFQANLVILSFRGTAQLFNGFSFSFLDKINLVLANFMCCIFLIYALSFYALMTQCRKYQYQAYLDDKKSSANSFTIQFYLLGVKNLLTGVINFLFLDTLTVFYFLFSLKACLIYICLKYQRYYKSQISLSLVIAYYLLGMIFDAYLIWSQPLTQSGQILLNQFYPQLIQRGCLYGFLIVIFLKIGFDITFQIKQQYCSSKKKDQSNQNKEQNESKKKKNQQNKVSPSQDNKTKQFFGDALVNQDHQHFKLKAIVKKVKTTQMKDKRIIKVKTNSRQNFINPLKLTIVYQIKYSSQNLSSVSQDKLYATSINSNETSAKTSQQSLIKTPIESQKQKNRRMKYTLKVRQKSVQQDQSISQ